MDLNQLQKMIISKIMDDEPMANHTSYGIGGQALAYIEPKSIKDLQLIKTFAKSNKISIYFIGSGSNILVSDSGINGFVISLEKYFKKILFEKKRCYVESGAKLSKVVKACIKRNLGGMETLIGIPGTIGGALIMNAGAFGNEISNYLIAVEILNNEGVVKRIPAEKITFSYRSSSLTNEDLIISAEFQLENYTSVEIQQKRDRANEQRKSTQPLKFRSAGSVFKNPKEHAAGYLIDKAGLKGVSVGGATVSDIHANFIINQDNATADELVKLIKLIQNKVYKKYSIALELELKTIGFPEGTFDV